MELSRFKRAKVPPKELLTFYTTCIRPITEYARPVFYNGLPKYLSNELERLQKPALRIICPEVSYADALVTRNLIPLYERKNTLTVKFFNEITSNTNSKLYGLLPERCGVGSYEAVMGFD